MSKKYEPQRLEKGNYKELRYSEISISVYEIEDQYIKPQPKETITETVKLMPLKYTQKQELEAKC